MILPLDSLENLFVLVDSTEKRQAVQQLFFSQGIFFADGPKYNYDANIRALVYSRGFLHAITNRVPLSSDRIGFDRFKLLTGAGAVACN